MKENNNSPQKAGKSLSELPDIDIIDLDNTEAFPEAGDMSNTEEFHETEDNFDEDMPAKSSADKGNKIFKAFFNIHTLFLLVAIAIVFIIVNRFQNWGVQVDLNEIFKDGQGTYDNTLDTVLPLTNAKGEMIVTDMEDPVIVAFGNAPFSDDRNSEDNLCNLIAKKTGATVYNCSVTGSYLSTYHSNFDAGLYALDAYSFYWLATLAAGMDVDQHFKAAEAMLTERDQLPPDAVEVYNTIKSIDFNEVDVITLMYDASDYYEGRAMTNFEDETDIQHFTGSMEAGVQLLQSIYPHIRFIIMSPAYAYALDEEGNYVSSDIYTYGEDVLSTYSNLLATSAMNCGVSFVDHMYGSITADNADKYLEDHVHLNQKGRELVADRFEYFFNYYTKGYGRSED